MCLLQPMALMRRNRIAGHDDGLLLIAGLYWPLLTTMIIPMLYMMMLRRQMMMSVLQTVGGSGGNMCRTHCQLHHQSSGGVADSGFCNMSSCGRG